MPDLARRLAVARGDEPADLVVRGGSVFSAFTREWLETDVAVVDGHVAGLGDYEGAEMLDASRRFVVPGFVDAHMHLETTKLLVDEFARPVLPLGTTTVVVDPHEIANVLGTDGVHWLLDPGAEHVDGHAPGVVGKLLNAYASAGIYSDHEAFTIEEGRERLRAGMWLLI